jgi:hypothetical protein
LLMGVLLWPHQMRGQGWARNGRGAPVPGDIDKDLGKIKQKMSVDKQRKGNKTYQLLMG